MSSSSVDKRPMKWIESLIDEHSFLPLLPVAVIIAPTLGAPANPG
jgi:hypothetical protein